LAECRFGRNIIWMNVGLVQEFIRFSFSRAALAFLRHFEWVEDREKKEIKKAKVKQNRKINKMGSQSRAQRRDKKVRVSESERESERE